MSIERFFPNSLDGNTSLARFLKTDRKWQKNDNYRLLKRTNSPKVDDKEERLRDLLPLLDLVGYPLIAHEFNTSCVSCHIANNERHGLFLRHKKKALKKTPFVYPEKLLDIDGYTKPMGGDGREEMDFMCSMNQFSLFMGWPIASQRVLHESIQAILHLHQKKEP